MKIGDFLQRALGLDFNKEVSIPSSSVEQQTEPQIQQQTTPQVQQQMTTQVQTHETPNLNQMVQSDTNNIQMIELLLKEINDLKQANYALLTQTPQTQPSTEELIYTLVTGGKVNGTDNTVG